MRILDTRYVTYLMQTQQIFGAAGFPAHRLCADGDGSVDNLSHAGGGAIDFPREAKSPQVWNLQL